MWNCMNPKSPQQKHFCLKGGTCRYRATQGLSKTNEVSHFHRLLFLACANCNTTSSTIVTKHFRVQLSGTWETSVTCRPFTSPPRRKALPERWFGCLGCHVFIYWLIALHVKKYFYIFNYYFLLFCICITQGEDSFQWGQELWSKSHLLPAGGVAPTSVPSQTLLLCPRKWGQALDPNSLFYIKPA